MASKSIQKGMVSHETGGGPAVAVPAAGNGSGKVFIRVRKPGWRKKFIDSLSRIPSVALAAQAAGVARAQPYKLRARNPKFAAEWQEAINQSIDFAEARLYQLGVTGTKRRLYMKLRENGKDVAKQIDEYTEYSERCLLEYLRAYKPDKYGVQRTELSGPGGAPITPVVAPTSVIIQIPPNGRDNPQPAIDVKPAQPALPAPDKPKPE